MSQLVTKIFKIKGMHCTSCALNIDFDLEDIDGIKEAKTSYAKQETSVTFDKNKVNVIQITQAIKKTGYIANVA